MPSTYGSRLAQDATPTLLSGLQPKADSLVYKGLVPDMEMGLILYCYSCSKALCWMKLKLELFYPDSFFHVFHELSFNKAFTQESLLLGNSKQGTCSNTNFSATENSKSSIVLPYSVYHWWSYSLPCFHVCLNIYVKWNHICDMRLCVFVYICM